MPMRSTVGGRSVWEAGTERSAAKNAVAKALPWIRLPGDRASSPRSSFRSSSPPAGRRISISGDPSSPSSTTRDESSGITGRKRRTSWRRPAIRPFSDQAEGRKRRPRPSLDLVIRDLDADGRPEVLFTTQTVDELDEGELLCFGPKGRLRWRFDAGREMRFGETIFSADYRIHGFVVADLDGDGREEILVVAHQQHRFPTRLPVLDADGKLRGEYLELGTYQRHRRRRSRRRREEGDHRGRPNNEYRTGFLAMFDPYRGRGLFPSNGPANISARD